LGELLPCTRFGLISSKGVWRSSYCSGVRQDHSRGVDPSGKASTLRVIESRVLLVGEFLRWLIIA
jgi:hypothetical protein